MVRPNVIWSESACVQAAQRIMNKATQRSRVKAEDHAPTCLSSLLRRTKGSNFTRSCINIIVDRDLRVVPDGSSERRLILQPYCRQRELIKHLF